MSIRKITIRHIIPIVSIFIMVTVLLIIVPSLMHYNQKSDDLNTEAIQETIQKYVVQCYADEGSYPKDLYYLEDNYGLILDEEKYTYVYEVFASNVMPEVKVYLK